MIDCKKVLFIIIIPLFLFFPNLSHARDVQHDQKYEAIVTKIVEEKEQDFDGQKQQYQKIEAVVTSKEDTGKIVTIENGNLPSINVPKYKAGDKVVVTKIPGPENQEMYVISDYVRRDAVAWLFILFVAVTLIIGRKKGGAALVGMIISFAIIFYFILPQILAGNNPVFITVLASLVIIPVNFYLSHGFNRQTHAAVISTLLALIFTGILATMFTELTKLSGFATEEVGFLESQRQGSINIKGLLLAGILVGILGVLDDVTVSQSSIVSQLKKTSPHLKIKDLYIKGMEVGKDHIASVVNTLILVYAGASLPLLLLFTNNTSPFTEVINSEIVVEEIVRTLVASIGLILAVPLTTLISAYYVNKNS